jgi:cyclophilin family peptidyl-prolyl cis-trans isomerase
MKKTSFLFLIAALVIIFSGCSSQPEEKKESQLPNPVADPGGYVPGMMDVNRQARQNIQNSVNQENERLQKAVEEGGVNANSNTNANSNNNNNMDTDLSKEYYAAVIKTNLGDIKVKFYGADSPKTVSNFLKLVQSGFYNGTKFHRVIKGFMIQGGDPNSKTKNVSTWGQGGPGYSFKDEFNSHKLVKGSLAMANSGPDTNGSQFFIVTGESTPWLDGKHTNFGEVASGMDVVMKIDGVITGENDRPMEDVVINSVEVLEK